LASEEEIKRSYRRLVSRFHPDVNPSSNAHFMLTEINEAYEILSDPLAKWTYDQRFIYQEEVPVFEKTPSPDVNVDSTKGRRGKAETEQEREQKLQYAKKRNRKFNKSMKILSCLSLFLSLVIFTDHYLPTETLYQKVYVGFKTEEVAVHKSELVSLFLPKGRQIEMYPIGINSEPIALLDGEVLFNNTSILGIIKTIQIGKVVFKPLNGLYDLMLLYGIVSLVSIYILSYKLENSMVLPTVLTFFDNMLVLAFFILWLME